jgi:hypothetical protein
MLDVALGLADRAPPAAGPERRPSIDGRVERSFRPFGAQTVPSV